MYDKLYQVWMTLDMWESLCKKARERGMKVSELVRFILGQWITDNS